MQPWRTPFPIWNQSAVPCPVLTVAFWLAYRFLRRQVKWSGIPVSFRIFQFVVIHTVKGFGVVNKAEVDFFFLIFLLFRWFNGCWPFDLHLVPLPFLNPVWTSGSSWFTYCWQPGLEDFEHYFASMWIKLKFTVVWAFFGITLLWDWNENWPFPVLWPLLSFPNLLA